VWTRRTGTQRPHCTVEGLEGSLGGLSTPYREVGPAERQRRWADLAGEYHPRSIYGSPSGPEVCTAMARVMADCRRFESDSKCSLTIVGEETEVVKAASEHAASVHGHNNTPELQSQIRGMLEPEEAYQAGSRVAEPFPA
jgi:hypothetical protein